MAEAYTYTVATNTVVCTGGTSSVPSTFAGFVTADRAGTGTSLKAATAASKTLTLTYAVRPVEFRALVVKLIVASKTTETDYLFITGTDAWDAAQTENIDVSAGNGSYTSIKRWRTITNISCSDATDGTGTVWADGTLAVTQDIWGVIWDLGGVLGTAGGTNDYSHTYRLSSKLNIGDGSTSTYFQDKKRVIILSNGIVTADDQAFITVAANATYQLGVLLDATDKSTRDGCHIHLEETTYRGASIPYCTSNTALVLLYSCSFSAMIYRRGYLSLGGTGSHRVWNCLMMHDVHLSAVGANIDVYNITECYSTYLAKLPSGTWNRIFSFEADFGIYAELTGTYTVSNIVAVNNNIQGNNKFIRADTFQGTVNIIDTISDNWDQSWIGSNNTGQFLRKYTCNINICDKDGVAISGAIVDCVDKYNTAVWAAGTVTTDASGNITQQTISYIRYYFDVIAQTTTYSPHKFTISKAGYQTLVLDAITVDHPIVWHLELQPPGPVAGDLLIDGASGDPWIFLSNPIIFKP